MRVLNLAAHGMKSMDWVQSTEGKIMVQLWSSNCFSVNFGQTIEGPKGHGLVPLFVSIFAPDNSRRWSSRCNATRYRRR